MRMTPKLFSLSPRLRDNTALLRYSEPQAVASLKRAPG